MEKKAIATTFLVGLLVLIAIVVILNPEEIVKYVKEMDWRYLVIALLLQGLSILIVSFRWNWFVNAAGYKTSSKDIVLISVAGQALNSITPASRWGGEPVKAYLLKKRQKVPIEAGMASIITEKITDIAAFCLMTVVAIGYSLYYYNVPPHVMFLLGLSLFFTFSVLFALFYFSLMKRVQTDSLVKLMEKYRWLTEKVPVLAQYKNKIQESLNNYYSTVLRITSKNDAWSIGVLFSMGYWFVEIARAYVLFRGLGIDIPMAVVITAYILSSMIGSFPLIPGDLGIVEATMIVIYSTSAIPSAVGGIVTIIDRLISYWLVILIGIPITWYLGVTSLKMGETNDNKNGSR